ncbi:voltage-gated potassium channel subunit beta-2-like isoform X3 [Artemia franciscana]|uniref:voltage-gated potassium channel subunit beta-2-like isoform X3 n=2 Tax=Artemia franciscana TaxID=6661 RepID=UPI0032D9CCA9
MILSCIQKNSNIVSSLSDYTISCHDFKTLEWDLTVKDVRMSHSFYRCKAPIASLDGLEDIPSNPSSGQDFGKENFETNGRMETHVPNGHTSMPTLRPQSRGLGTAPGLKYRNLGKSGLRVSNLGLGTWVTFSSHITDEQAEEVIATAYESGINLFDLSEVYCGFRAEILLGKVLRSRGWRRSSYVVTTKLFWSHKSEERGLSRKHIIESVRGSLERLQLDYIDIIIVHKADPMCPMEEVVRSMNHVINSGWAMYWGTSRWSPAEISEAYNNCRQFNCITPICEQTEYHYFQREKTELHMPEMYNKLGVGLIAWSPVLMGIISGKSDDGIPSFTRASFKKKYSSLNSAEEDSIGKEGPPWYGSGNPRHISDDGKNNSDRLSELALLAEKMNCTSAQLSIAWALKCDAVQCLLVGAATSSQLHEQIQALQLTTRLTTNMMNEIERILENKPVRAPMISTLALRWDEHAI